ncbi:MAG: hypothetical protein IT488_07375 [Gammaproteobacteria bacterium]|nr:hypothetical protein [Gammaproteobacteria bacterium]
MNVRTRRYITGGVALIAGCLVNYAGDRLLGVDLELWLGLSTFGIFWMLDMFLVPMIAGIVVAAIFGLGGKWLCYFPPLIVRIINYSVLYSADSLPQGAQMLTFPLWILIVILAVEAAAFGGVAGEIIVKRTYGRLPRHLVYRDKNQEATGE